MKLLKRNGIINNSLKSQNKTMLSYCLKCKKNTENITPRVSKSNNGEIGLLSKCHICGSKNQGFLKNKKQVEH